MYNKKSYIIIETINVEYVAFSKRLKRQIVIFERKIYNEK